MNVGDETREVKVTVTRTVSFTAPDLAQAAQLDSPDQWKFADSGPDATATLVREDTSAA